FVTPVQRVGENRRSLELRNGRIPRIFRNNLAYEDDTDSQFTCILRNFGLEHGFVHLQGAGITLPYSATITTSLVAVNGEMFFGAHDATHGYQLWESNGTSSGTQMLTDVHAPYGISPGSLTAVGNTLYFTADDGPDGVQLWKSDGTPSG